jgi:hypothetical protein
MSRSTPKERSGERTRRFPRYPKADDIGELVKVFWERPKFSVRETSNKTEFVFTVAFNVRNRIRRRQLASYMLLFEENQNGLKPALLRAFETAIYGTDRVRDLTERALFRTLVEALGMLFQKANSCNERYRGVLDGTAATLLEAAKRKKRPPESERHSRASRLLPYVKSLRELVRDNPNEKTLRKLIEEKFPFQWIREVTSGGALENLPEIPGHSGRARSLGGPHWTARQLAVGILWCEERRRDSGFNVRPKTILEDYIPLGRKINATKVATAAT